MLSNAGFTALISISEVAQGEIHRLDSFSCGKSTLDDFLRSEAANFHSDHLSHTSLLFHEDFPSVAGYITLSNDAIPLKTSEIGDLGLAYETELPAFPAVKIGRLAVHKELKRQGVGKRILDLAIGELVGVQTVTTGRLLITDAINESEVIDFYQKYGFMESYWAAEKEKNHGGKKKERLTIKMIRDIYG